MDENSETLSERAERITLALTAEEYVQKGYRVLREPKLDFLPGIRPDLVVEKDGEKKVIEVKSRSSLLGNEAIVEMAKAVYAQPGWSFDLQMIGEPEALDTPEASQSYTVDEILRRLIEAENLLESGHLETAFILAWATCEAAIRELLASNGFGNAGITITTHLFDQAVHHGVISRDDYFNLLDTAAFRNAFVHGFNVASFDPSVVGDLIAATRNIAFAIMQGPVDKEILGASDFWTVADPASSSK